MRHHATVRAILRRVRVRVRRVDVEDDAVGARVTAAVDAVAVQQGELVERLALARVGEGELAVVAEGVGVAAWRGGGG